MVRNVFQRRKGRCRVTSKRLLSKSPHWGWFQERHRHPSFSQQLITRFRAPSAYFAGSACCRWSRPSTGVTHGCVIHLARFCFTHTSVSVVIWRGTLALEKFQHSSRQQPNNCCRGSILLWCNIDSTQSSITHRLSARQGSQASVRGWWSLLLITPPVRLFVPKHGARRSTLLRLTTSASLGDARASAGNEGRTPFSTARSARLEDASCSPRAAPWISPQHHDPEAVDISRVGAPLGLEHCGCTA